MSDDVNGHNNTKLVFAAQPVQVMKSEVQPRGIVPTQVGPLVFLHICMLITKIEAKTLDFVHKAPMLSLACNELVTRPSTLDKVRRTTPVGTASKQLVQCTKAYDR